MQLLALGLCRLRYGETWRKKKDGNVDDCIKSLNVSASLDCLNFALGSFNIISKKRMRISCGAILPPPYHMSQDSVFLQSFFQSRFQFASSFLLRHIIYHVMKFHTEHHLITFLFYAFIFC